MKRFNRYSVGYTGACLWLISWAGALNLWPTPRTGGIFMLITGGIGYVLLIVSMFLPWRWE